MRSSGGRARKGEVGGMVGGDLGSRWMCVLYVGEKRWRWRVDSERSWIDEGALGQGLSEFWIFNALY